MGLLDFGRDDERKPIGSVVAGYGGNYYTSSAGAISSHLSGIGQTTDPVTGITGRTAQEVYDKARAGGMSASGLNDLVGRIGR